MHEGKGEYNGEMRNLSRELKMIKVKNQREVLKLKSKICEIRHLLNGLNGS